MNSVSVVVPVYNEELNAPALYREISSVMEGLARRYQIIFIDDGSKDNTVERLLEAGGQDPHVSIVELKRNFGQTAAMAAGLEHSSGDIVITLDGDLQNDPADIPRLIEKLERGCDMVAGWRKYRKDPLISRKIPSWIANWIISKSTNVKLHDYGCTLKAMTREVAHGIKLYGEMHRFIPALADEIGAEIAEIPVNHRPRKYGKSKYGISRTVRVILDLITVKFLLGYSKRPIHLFGSVALISGCLGALILAVMTYQRFAFGVAMGNRPLMSLGVMLVIIGFQFICFGLLAEVLARTYHESQGKPIYSVRRIIQCREEQPGKAEKRSAKWAKKAVG